MYTNNEDICSLPGSVMVPLSQSVNPNTITPGTVACQANGIITAENSWWRAYDLARWTTDSRMDYYFRPIGIQRITASTTVPTVRMVRVQGRSRAEPDFTNLTNCKPPFANRHANVPQLTGHCAFRSTVEVNAPDLFRKQCGIYYRQQCTGPVIAVIFQHRHAALPLR